MPVVVALFLALATPALAATEARTFELTYATGVPRAAGPVRLWIPFPHGTAEQTVSTPRLAPALAARATRDAQGNTMFYVELPAASTPVTVTWTARITRRESRPALLPFTPADHDHHEQFLAEQRLGVVSHPAVDRALEAALASRPPAAQVPRAIYDHVLAVMTYDKTAPGWGEGDTVRACRVGKGNCTDFHALFISMMRRSRTPARFSVGLSVPTGSPSGQLPGYHCWAYFASPDAHWIPVDASEAWKRSARRDYFFGQLPPDRVELSRGRDLVLVPKQDGPPLNFFVNPFAEVGGKPFPLSREARFRDTR